MKKRPGNRNGGEVGQEPIRVLVRKFSAAAIGKLRQELEFTRLCTTIALRWTTQSMPHASRADSRRFYKQFAIKRAFVEMFGPWGRADLKLALALNCARRTSQKRSGSSDATSSDVIRTDRE